MQRWQYKRLGIKMTNSLGRLSYELVLEDGKSLKDEAVWRYVDDLGQEGWEMITAVPEVIPAFGLSVVNAATTLVLWFKRPQ
jgi:hypothetical protein